MGTKRQVYYLKIGSNIHQLERLTSYGEKKVIKLGLFKDVSQNILRKVVIIIISIFIETFIKLVTIF